MSVERIPLGELIVPAQHLTAGRRQLPILSMTMHDGLVEQSSKFKKRIASADTAAYKVVARNQLVVGFPIDEGVLSFQDLYEEAVVSPAYDVWNLKHSGVQPRYLEAFLRSPIALTYYASKLRGTTARRRSLPDDIFLDIRVPFPPPTEQRRIADVLDRAEALRAKRRAALAQFDTLKAAAFRQLFGGASSSWPESPLSNIVAEFRYGTSAKSTGRGDPVLRIPNVVGGVIDTSDLKRVTVAAAERARLTLADGDVLFVRTNGNPENVGRCAVFERSAVGGAGQTWIFASYLIRAKVDRAIVAPVFLREFMLGAEGRRQLRSHSKTSAGQFNINTESLGAIAIPVPPISLQLDFARRVAAIESLSALHRASLAKLDELFASLQHRAFRGEL